MSPALSQRAVAPARSRATSPRSALGDDLDERAQLVKIYRPSRTCSSTSWTPSTAAPALPPKRQARLARGMRQLANAYKILPREIRQAPRVRREEAHSRLHVRRHGAPVALMRTSAPYTPIADGCGARSTRCTCTPKGRASSRSPPMPSASAASSISIPRRSWSRSRTRTGSCRATWTRSRRRSAATLAW
jgi:hypothetical protein